METVIEVDGLTHHYGTRRAVDQMSFDVRQGEVVALLGPNGAGKTTTVRLLNGLFIPSNGTMRVLGYDPVKQGHEVRKHTGVLTETPALYERLTARQNLEFFGTLAGMSPDQIRARSTELLEFFELTERANERASTYSKGMKQRLALSRALLHRPSLLFLDEPTSGLDPEASQQVHNLIDNVRRIDGQTVLLATHNLFEAERLCDRVAVMNRGRLLAFGSLDELRSRISPGMWLDVELLSAPPDRLVNGLAGVPGVMDIQAAETPGALRLRVADRAVAAEIARFLVEQGGQLAALKPQYISLEEIYFTLQSQANGEESGREPQEVTR